MNNTFILPRARSDDVLLLCVRCTCTLCSRCVSVVHVCKGCIIRARTCYVLVPMLCITLRHCVYVLCGASRRTNFAKNNSRCCTQSAGGRAWQHKQCIRCMRSRREAPLKDNGGAACAAQGRLPFNVNSWIPNAVKDGPNKDTFP